MSALKSISALLLALLLNPAGCRAQTPANVNATPSGAHGTTLSLETARRIEVLIRQRSSVPPDYVIQISDRTKSELPGFDQVSVTYSANGETSKPTTFLISEDQKTLAQFNRYDISKDPKELVSAEGRPARGGPADAPVLIVGFDDLECPYCAKMHTQIFPALTARYHDQVRVVYRDFPLEQHPWAVRAAVDSNCLGAQSGAGYWNLVDYIHAHAPDLGGTDHSLAKADEQLDTLAKEEGARRGVKADVLSACIAKQDQTPIEVSKKEAETLGVDSTPALFINGERIEGAVPIEYIYRIVDQALLAAGKTPPPPVPVPPMPGATKAGN